MEKSKLRAPLILQSIIVDGRPVETLSALEETITSNQFRGQSYAMATIDRCHTIVPGESLVVSKTRQALLRKIQRGFFKLGSELSMNQNTAC